MNDFYQQFKLNNLLLLPSHLKYTKNERISIDPTKLFIRVYCC